MSRAGFYRRFRERSWAEYNVELRDRIQRIAIENRRYGYRRVTVELRRQGFTVNHKKVLRLLREDNLLAIRKRRFVLTTDSVHFLPVYPNLAGRLRVDGVDQLWQADITYDGYPVDSGNPNILWFWDFLGFCNRVNNHLVSRGIHGHRLLDEPIEEFASAFGFAAVETKGELVQVVVQMFVAHGALMGAQQPALEQ